MEKKSSEKDIYDQIYIGSSPCLLFEALQSSGKKKMILEQAPQVGGAWHNISLFKLQNVEAACHLLENYKGVYNFLQKNGIELEAQEPPPLKLHSPWLQIKYSSLLNDFIAMTKTLLAILKQSLLLLISVILFKKENISAYKDKLHNSSRSIKKIILNIKGKIELKDKRIQYFSKGSGHLIESLLKSVKAKNIEVNLNQQVDEVIISSSVDLVEIKTKRNQFYCKKVIVSEGLNINSLILNGRKVNLPNQAKSISHCYVLVDGLESKKISYLHFVNDKKVHRVTDITEYCQGEISHYRLLLFELRKSFRPDNAMEIFNEIKKYKLIKNLSDIKVISWDMIDYDYKTVSHSELENLKLLKVDRDKFCLLSTRGDLTRAFKRIYNIKGAQS